MNRINTFKSDSRNAIGNVWTESGRFLLLLLTTMMIYFHCSTNQLPTSSSWSIKYLEFFAFFLLPFENWYKSSDWKAFHYLLKNILIRDDDHWASNWNIYLHITASIPLMDAIYQHFFWVQIYCLKCAHYFEFYTGIYHSLSFFLLIYAILLKL